MNQVEVKPLEMIGGLSGIFLFGLFFFNNWQINERFWNWFFVIAIVAFFSFLGGLAVGQSKK